MHSTILTLLGHLNCLPDADSLKVFGSLAKGAEKPADVDVALLALGCATFEEAQDRHALTVRPMLNLAWRHYGWLDPFVLTQEGLFVRNDRATGWVKAAKQKELVLAIEQGVPLRELHKALKAPKCSELMAY